METFTHDDVVEMVRGATGTLFETMLSGELHAMPGYRTSKVEEYDESIFCLIGFTGDYVGSGSLHCSGACAIRLASSLLMAEFAKVDEEVLDAVAEITNMIVGNFKNTLEEKVGVIGISTPTVIFGHQYAARNFGASEWTVVPFTIDGDTFDVRIRLERNKEIQRLLDRHSAEHANSLRH
ncbi:MAG: chemotaxis protein CheX [Bryobacterales bacterium]|nr:chemotaxis protein CheX [Bryobacterales bacterium]